MSRFNVCVLVKKDSLTLEEVGNKAGEMLAEFNTGKQIEPYKFYVKADEIQRMAKQYGIDPANLSALAERFEDWNGDKGAVDEGGFYGISTKNPGGHIDEWSVAVEVKPEDRGRLLFGRTGEETVVKALITPDGKWISGPWAMSGTPDAEQKFNEWEKEITPLLDEHKDAVAVLAYCHS